MNSEKREQQVFGCIGNYDADSDFCNVECPFKERCIAEQQADSNPAIKKAIKGRPADKDQSDQGLVQ